MSAKSIYKSPAGERAIMDQYEALLARWPVPWAPLDVATRYGGAFVVASGSESAAPLVLIHGAGTNSSMWAGDVGEYSRHYRVYAVDLPGEPGKSAPVRPDWKSSAYAESGLPLTPRLFAINGAEPPRGIPRTLAFLRTRPPESRLRLDDAGCGEC